MVKFRQKNFSILSSAIKGATIGTTIGSLAAGLSNFIPVFRKGGEESENKLNRLAIVGTGTVIGAGLGTLAGLISEGDKFISRKNVDARLMETVRENLLKSGLKEGVHFTRDPKTATDIRTKVCIVITKYSGELRLLINTVADSKLKNLVSDITKNLPNTSVINKSASDKYNEITLSSISDSSANAGLITGIAERFIHTGYPVYLVEVG